MITGKRILVLSAHTDDAELGCGGTIHKLSTMDNHIRHLAFSTVCRGRMHDKMAVKKYRTEFHKAAAILKINDRSVYDFPMREFPKCRQEILELLCLQNVQYCPDIVFVHCPNDTHQDHKTLSEEAFRAFKTVTLLGYELPWNNIKFNNILFSILKLEDVKKKTLAISQYVSQRHIYPYMSENKIEALALSRGMQIHEEYAETFEVMRWVLY